MTGKNSEKNAGAARKAAADAIRAGEVIEKTEEFWGGNLEGDGPFTATMEGAWKFRGTTLIGDVGDLVVDQVLDAVLDCLAEKTGWRTLSEIPQGRHIASRFREANRHIVAQAVASSGPLNQGYGLKPQPIDSQGPSYEDEDDSGNNDDAESNDVGEEKDGGDDPATPSGNTGDGGLLTPGSTPQSAIDVDLATNDHVREERLRAGFIYENRLRRVDNACKKIILPEIPGLKTCLMSARYILWSFKLHARQHGNVWDVLRHPVSPVLPFDDGSAKAMYPGVLTRALMPADMENALHTAPFHGTYLASLNPTGETGWLTDCLIEMIYMFRRPQLPPNNLFYLDVADTCLLNPQTRVANFMTLAELYQYKMENGVIDPILLESVFGPALTMPKSTTRVVFFCNPKGNHWIVVLADLSTSKRGKKTKKTGTVYVLDSIRQHAVSYCQNEIMQYLTILGSLPDSPFAGVDWSKGQFLAGNSQYQTNDSDCGLFALDNLLDLSNGLQPGQRTLTSPLERRASYCEIVVELVRQSTGQKVHDLHQQNLESGASSFVFRNALSAMIATVGIQHLRFMITQAQPHLIMDIDGQRRNIDRIMPLLNRTHFPTSAVQVLDVPKDCLPLASFVLNDDDIARFRPSPDRRPDCLAVYVRWSSPRCESGTQLDQAHRILRNWVETVYPGWTDYNAMLLCAVHSSKRPFAMLSPTGVAGRRGGGDRLASQLPAFIQVADHLNAQGSVGPERRRPLIQFVTMGFDGITTDIGSLQIPVARWENIDFGLSVGSPFAVHERQPFDAAYTSDHTGHCSWAHYSLDALAARAATGVSHVLGPDLNAHNQMVYLMDQINEFKGSTLTSEQRLQFPIAEALTGANTRTIDSSKAKTQPTYLLDLMRYQREGIELGTVYETPSKPAQPNTKKHKAPANAAETETETKKMKKT